MWDARAATAGLRLHRHRDQEQQRHTHTHTHTHMSADDEDIYRRGSVNVLDIAVDAPAARPRNPRRLLHHKPQRHTLAGASPAGIYLTDDPSDLAEPSSLIVLEPPPRNPRRLLQRRHHSQDSDWPYAAASYPELQPITDSESNSTSDGDAYSSSPASNSKLASTYARRPPALDQISPPSSPETGAFKNVAPVSPIDEDDAGFHREYPLQGHQQSQPFTTQLQTSNGPVQAQYMPYQPAVNMYGASFENPRSVKDIPIPLFENPRSIKDVPIPQGSLPRSNKMRLHLTSESSVAQRFRFLAKGKSESPEPFAERPRSRAASRAGSSRPGSSKGISVGYSGLRNISAPIPQSQPAFMMDSTPRQQMLTDRDLLPSIQARKPMDTTSPAARVPSYDAYTIDAGNGANAPVTSPPNDQDYPTPPSMHSAQQQSPVDPNWTPTGPKLIKRKPAQNQQNQPSAPTNRSSSIPASLLARHPPASAAAAAAPPPQAQPQARPQPQPQPRRERSYADEASMKPAPLFAHTTRNTWNTETPWQAVGEQTPANTPPDAPFLSRQTPDTGPDPEPSQTTTTAGHGARASSLYEAYAQMPRMPPPSEAPPSKPADNEASSRTNPPKHKPTMSTTKPLPPAPPELASSSSDDRIAQLNATLASLAHRKVNINKSIQQMTELMPRDNLMASAEVLRKREIEKQKVEGLKKELAEIQLEEYDLGLKLHRAYKRLDRGADYEPTTLWVRRVNT
ncbi:hypothetical protein MKX07_002685 [Trichoderma sp. CBMAI-0711]|uniref:Uncharacterized protein n=1 Tax=Trichoderma parareesei TaxID=858221 RepID=A0A2H2ZSC3_TRIPA|nr:hypothetical protein MKX07_002685 [Trichoderma sp. CBMAI-0711]OTA04946.1 hypothetical protein A9Z42_0055460 [Trichoderma parareesei]